MHERSKDWRIAELTRAFELIAGHDCMACEPEQAWYRDLACAVLAGESIERFVQEDPHDYWNSLSPACGNSR